MDLPSKSRQARFFLPFFGVKQWHFRVQVVPTNKQPFHHALRRRQDGCRVSSHITVSVFEHGTLNFPHLTSRTPRSPGRCAGSYFKVPCSSGQPCVGDICQRGARRRALRCHHMSSDILSFHVSRPSGTTTSDRGVGDPYGW